MLHRLPPTRAAHDRHRPSSCLSTSRRSTSRNTVYAPPTACSRRSRMLTERLIAASQYGHVMLAALVGHFIGAAT
jgi:hypothetical protein